MTHPHVWWNALLGTFGVTQRGKAQPERGKAQPARCCLTECTCGCRDNMDGGFALPTKPSYLTQANALFRKNSRYQVKNWCGGHPGPGKTGLWRAQPPLSLTLLPPLPRGTNLCLVLTPLTFSVVLGSAPPRLRVLRKCSLGGD